MWQFCKWCDTYYNKLGITCPNCFIPFARDASSLPDSTMQARLNQIWNERFAFQGQELYVPEIERSQLGKEQVQ